MKNKGLKLEKFRIKISKIMDLVSGIFTLLGILTLLPMWAIYWYTHTPDNWIVGILVVIIILIIYFISAIHLGGLMHLLGRKDNLRVNETKVPQILYIHIENKQC